jgi:hypothetical protein
MREIAEFRVAKERASMLFGDDDGRLSDIPSEDENMYRILAEFFGFFIQDFDLIYERDTDPIDQFCSQHTIRDQKEALVQLKDFREAVLAEKRTVQDLVRMGLEWYPSDDHGLATWLQRLIDYLEGKIANAGGDEA